MKLVVAEKPSVAQSISAVLGATEKKDGYIEGNGYLVSWCVGHLVELAQPESYGEQYAKWCYADLPIMPVTWKYDVPKDKKKQLGVLRCLMADKRVDTIVCATDAGREGELIFRLVYDRCGCKKPVERLWISSMEDAAIRDGFKHLRPGADFDCLYRAALCRAGADWLVGINATRLFSVLYGVTLNVGRVMTPTLALLVRREADIQAFKSKTFFVPEILCGQRGSISSFTASGEKMQDKAGAESIRKVCDGQTAAVRSLEKQEKTVLPPRLYDLTTLQRECNRLYGFTAQQTLDYLQSLYEKKLATYPRTDSQYITEDMQATVSSLALWLGQNMPFAEGMTSSPDLSRMIDNSKVSDHHAIIPTSELAGADLSVLPTGERDVLMLLCCRLLCAAAHPHTFEAVTATLDCSGHSFTAKGKTILREGWKAIDRAFRAGLKKKPQEDSGGSPDGGCLPDMKEGQRFENITASVREGKTVPPKHYTEDTLLSAMETASVENMTEIPHPDDIERKGLGTPATRAATLEKLVATSLVERKKKNLLPTVKGVNLIAVLPDVVKSPALTAEWESKLKEVEDGKTEASAFSDGIARLTCDLVKEHSAPNPEFATLFAGMGGSQREAVGACPRCGTAVYESKKCFSCSNRDCSFALWRDNRFFSSKRKEVNRKIAVALLKEGRASVSGLYSEKTGKTYNAVVLMDDTGDRYVNFKLEFPTKKGGGE